MSTEARVTTLERVMVELAAAQVRTQQNLDQLSHEMREFKEEMRAYREASQAERRALKEEMRAYREASQAERRALKEEMRVYRETSQEETRALREEMRVYRETSQEETREFKEEMRASREAVNEQIAAVSTQMGQLSNKMGTLVEDIVAPSIPHVFARFFGVQDPGWLVRPRPRDPSDPSRRQEFDLVAWGGDTFLINETKSRLSPKDIEELSELLPRAASFFPEAEGKGVFGSLASFYVDPSIVAAAERRGLLVFGLSTGLLQVLNHPGFEPRRF